MVPRGHIDGTLPEDKGRRKARVDVLFDFLLYNICDRETKSFYMSSETISAPLKKGGRGELSLFLVFLVFTVLGSRLFIAIWL